MHILDTGPIFMFLTTDCVPQLLAALGNSRVHVPAAVDFDEMYASRKDRGENMAILHGVLLARSGEQVVLVCDEEAGTSKIHQQANALRMQHMQGRHEPGGRIQHADTLTLLRWAIEVGSFQSPAHFVRKYHAMASLDEALPKDVRATGLTKSPPWPPM